MPAEHNQNISSKLEQQLKTLLHAQRVLGSESTRQGMRQQILAFSRQLVSADAGAVGVLENQRMKFREYFCAGATLTIDYDFPAHLDMPGRSPDLIQPLINDVSHSEPPIITPACQALGTTFRIRLPIISPRDNCLLGCLQLYRKSSRNPFEPEDLEILHELLASGAHALCNLLEVQRQCKTQNALSNTLDHYRQLVESTSDWVWEVDRNGTYTYASPRLKTLLGYQPEEIIGLTPFDLMPAEEAQRVSHIFLTQIAANELPIERLVNTNLHRNGHEVVVETSGIPFYDEKGEFAGYRGIDRDISTRFSHENGSELARLVLQHTPEGVMITDRELRIIDINPAFTHTTGYSFDEIKGCKPSILSSGKHGRGFYRAMWHELGRTGKWQGEIWNRRKDGEVYPEWLNINTLKNEQGEVMFYAAMFSDISSQEHIRKRLHVLAYYDDLTGLPNRELFHDRLDNAIAQASRHGKKLGLMFLDIDRFKNINDTLGHKTGDALLKMVASKLLRCVRDSDSVSRIGGDEFTILLGDIQHADDVVKIALKIVDAFSSPLRLSDGMELYATTSIGICIYPDDGDGSEALIKNADTAMYRAKEAGRNNYQFYTEEMSRHFSERLALENDLRSAIEANRIEVAYQPQIDMLNRRIIGFEALARWHHPERGWVPPDKFIPIAEDSGLIYRIGEQVMQQACKQIKYWRDNFDDQLTMAINFSGHQLCRIDIVQYITDTIDALHLPRESIELELTESSLMDNSETVTDIMAQLSSTGIKISIDDFGTGYSSLSYIKRFAIDKLKIDRSFVQDINNANRDYQIVTTIIAMANNLGLEVIAEGVETHEQIAFLMKNGCHRMQGHYFSKAESVATISRLLARPDPFTID